MTQNNLTVSLQRRSFIRSSAIAGAAIGSIGTVQADDDDELHTHYEAPEETIVPQDVEYQDVENASAVIFKNCNPWEITANEDILDELGIEYGVLPSTEVENIRNIDVDSVVFASAQNQEYYDDLVSARSEVRNWVSNGGTLIGNFSIGWPCEGALPAPFLPKDVEVINREPFEEIGIAAPDHPVVDGLTEEDLSNWNASSDGYFVNIPDDTQIVYGLDGAPGDYPAYIEYEHGSGRVLATMTPWEWGVRNVGETRHMINEFIYAAEGGGDVPDEDSELSLGDLEISSTIDGEAAQGEQIELTATATNTTDETINETIAFDFDGETLGTIDVELGADESTEIFTELDVGTVIEPGETTTGYATTGEQPQQAVSDGELRPTDQPPVDDVQLSNDTVATDDEASSHEAPDAEIDPQEVEYQDVDDAEVVIYKNCQPWEVPSNEIVLDELGISYSVLPPTEAQNISTETVAIIPSTQDQSFYDTIYSARDEIQNWVENGGTLVGHMTGVGWPCNGQWPGTFLPEGVRVIDGESFDSIEISNPDHPTVDDLSDRNLSGWGASSHGYFENLPDSANTIWGLDDDAKGIPAYIEYESGNGRVLAAMQTMEWGVSNADEPRPLINELQYAVAGAGDVGGGDTVTTELMIRELGDVNHDGSVAVSDSVFARRYIQGLPIEEQFNPSAADLNQDGEVTVDDARQISEKIVGNDAGIPEREATVEDAGTR